MGLSLQWRRNGRDGVSNHQPHHCLFNSSFRRRSKKTSKLRVTGLCAGNSPVTGEFPAQRVNNAENVSIWWRHHGGRMYTPMNWVIDQVMACRLFDPSHLHIPMLTCLSLDHWEHTSVILEGIRKIHFCWTLINKRRRVIPWPRMME